MRQQNPDGRLVTTTPPTSCTGPKRETLCALSGFAGHTWRFCRSSGRITRPAVPSDIDARPTVKFPSSSRQTRAAGGPLNFDNLISFFFNFFDSIAAPQVHGDRRDHSSRPLRPVRRGRDERDA